MKQVNSKVYDQSYYQDIYGRYDPLTKLDFHKVYECYQDLVKLLPPQKGQKVIDFGCGTGNLSFYLALKFDASVLGIDYSKAAIEICQSRLKVVNSKVRKNIDLKFKNLNNNNLEGLKGYDLIYLCDVVEHMYDHEIKQVFTQFKANNPNVQIAIHTDNFLYLKFIRPLLDLLGLISGGVRLGDLKTRSTEEKKVHVNLTTLSRFTALMNSIGYEKISHRYPEVTRERVQKQLGSLGKLPLFTSLTILSLKILQPLSPTFLAAFQPKNES